MTMLSDCRPVGHIQSRVVDVHVAGFIAYAVTLETIHDKPSYQGSMRSSVSGLLDDDGGGDGEQHGWFPLTMTGNQPTSTRSQFQPVRKISSFIFLIFHIYYFLFLMKMTLI